MARPIRASEGMGPQIQSQTVSVPRPGDLAPRWDELESAAAPGVHDVDLDIAGIRVRLQGFGAEQADWIGGRYGVFAGPAGGATPGLTVSGREAPSEGFLQLDRSGPAEVYRLVQEVDGDRVRAWSYRFAGWFNEPAGTGRVWFSDRDGKGFESSLENFLRVVYSSLALRRSSR